MELIDTHAHLASHKLKGETAELVKRAQDAGVGRIVTIGTDVEDSAENVRLAAEFSGVYAAVGVHPTSIHEVPQETWLDEIRALAAKPKVQAIGEIGLDFYHPPQDGSEVSDWRSRQADFFTKQLDLAVELDLPVVVHQRSCSAEVLEIIKPYSGKVRAVFHCFVDSAELGNELIDLGFHVSFTGVATYKSAPEVADCAAALPLDRIMVETDSPYLAPVPNRGKRNEPAFTRNTAEFIAARRGISLDEFAEATTATAVEFFGLNRPN
ncbi:MAG: TatD DNase family protein [Verrucomicrobiales bacterium]|jgi:TatD DNase family protein